MCRIVEFSIALNNIFTGGIPATFYIDYSVNIYDTNSYFNLDNDYFYGELVDTSDIYVEEPSSEETTTEEDITTSEEPATIGAGRFCKLLNNPQLRLVLNRTQFCALFQAISDYNAFCQSRHRFTNFFVL